MEKLVPDELLKEFYKARLREARISSRADLDEALESGKIDLRYKPDEIITEEERNKIEDNNPDNIEIEGKSYEVDYSYDDIGKEFIAKIKISTEDLLELSKEPVLLSGRKLTMEVFGESEYYSEAIGKDLDELKKKINELFTEKQWYKFISGSESARNEPIYKFNVLEDSVPELPEPIQYGEDSLTGEKLYAYPYFSIDEVDTLHISYRPSQEEADAELEQFHASIEHKKEKRKNETEEEKNIRKVQQLVQELNDKFNELSDDLSYAEYNKLRRAVNMISFNIREDPTDVLGRAVKVRDLFSEKENQINEKKALATPEGISAAKEKLTSEIELLSSFIEILKKLEGSKTIKFPGGVSKNIKSFSKGLENLKSKVEQEDEDDIESLKSKIEKLGLPIESLFGKLITPQISTSSGEWISEYHEKWRNLKIKIVENDDVDEYVEGGFAKMEEIIEIAKNLLVDNAFANIKKGEKKLGLDELIEEALGEF